MEVACAVEDQPLAEAIRQVLAKQEKINNIRQTTALFFVPIFQAYIIRFIVHGLGYSVMCNYVLPVQLGNHCITDLSKQRRTGKSKRRSSRERWKES